MRVYIVRHGETDWNVDRKLQGRTDIPLNHSGREQAKEVVGAIDDIGFDYCFASPLKRAYETAQILLSNQNIEIVCDNRLKEMCFGVNEGRPKEERTENFSLFFKEPEKYVAPEGAETIEELNSRTAEFIEEVLLPLAKKSPDCNVMIAGHGAVNKSLIQYFCHKDICDFWSGEFEKNLYCAVVVINDDSYELLEDFHSLIQ